MNFSRAQSESEVFKVLKSGKTKRKGWKRMVTKVTFVGDNFTRKPPKFERFIRPMGLRMNKAHVTHPELKATFCLPIIGVKKNPSSPMYTNLGVITKVHTLHYFPNTLIEAPCILRVILILLAAVGKHYNLVRLKFNKLQI